MQQLWKNTRTVTLAAVLSSLLHESHVPLALTTISSWGMAKEKLPFWNGPEKKVWATLAKCWEQGLGLLHR